MEQEIGKMQSQNRVVDANGKFAKGNRSGGRPEGSKNRLTVTVKEVILRELEQLGPEHLHQWALVNPTEFYRIAARLIPAAKEISGREGGLLESRSIREYSTEELYRMIED